MRVGHVVAAQLQDQHHDLEARVVAASTGSDDTVLGIMMLILQLCRNDMTRAHIFLYKGWAILNAHMVRV